MLETLWGGVTEGVCSSGRFGTDGKAEGVVEAAQCGVFIVNWNSWDLLDACLRSVAEAGGARVQVWVIDNGSTIPQEAGFLERHQGVRFLEGNENVGFAAANNKILGQLGDCDWMFLLNPDTVVGPECVKRLLDAAADFPEISVFAPRLMQARAPTLLDGEGDTYHISGLPWRSGHGAPVDLGDVPEREIFSACAAAALYRRDAFESVGGFDEDFFCYVEDVDLGFRLRLAGHRCLLVPDAVVEHVGSATTGGKDSDFAVYHGHRNLVWAYVKNMPGLLFWAFLPLHIAMNVAAVLWYTAQGRGPVILRAKRDAIRGLPRMWRKRREIQRTRKASIGEIWRVLDKGLGPGFERWWRSRTLRCKG